MQYKDATEEMQDAQRGKTDNRNFRMAIVTNVVGGRPRIKFYGEETESQKDYRYLQSYSPIKNDKVLLCKISSSFVIIGKVV